MYLYRVCAYECRFFEARSRPQIPRAEVSGSCGWLDMAAVTELRSSARPLSAHKCSHFSNPGESTFDIGKSVVIFEVSLEAELAI